MPLLAYVDEFYRQPWPSLFALSGIGAVCLSLTHHHASFAGEWSVMLLAMMPILLAQPITHVLSSSRRGRRIRGIIAFGLGYAFVWMIAGPLLLTISLLINGLGVGVPAEITTMALALIWSSSPWRLMAHNRCHRIRNLAVFGWRADVDAITFGLVHGVWCFSSCWAWMLVPVVIGTHHATAMIVVTLIMFIERLAPHGRPRWGLPLATRVFVMRSVHA